jgi:WD40 repeat protein
MELDDTFKPLRSHTNPEIPSLMRPSSLVVPLQTLPLPANPSSKNLREELQHISAYFSEFKPSQIVTPFQGTSLRMSKDKKKFYFGSREGRIAIAQIDSKAILQDIDLKEGIIRSIALCQNDTYLYSGGQGGAIRKFLIEDMSEVQQLVGHRSEVNTILISADEATLFSLGDTGTVFKWDLNEAVPTPLMLYTHQCQAYALDLSADNNYLASGGKDNVVHVYSLLEMRTLRAMKDPDFGSIWSVKITAKNSFIAFGDDRPVVYVYDFRTFERLHEMRGHIQKVRCMTASFDEATLITGGYDNKIFVWDIYQRHNGFVLNGHTDGVKAMILSDDNTRLYSMSHDCSIKTWKLPKLDQYTIKRPQKKFENMKRMVFGKRSKDLIYVLNGSDLFSFDINTEEENLVESFAHFDIESFTFSKQSDLLCLVCTSLLLKEKNKANEEFQVVNYSILLYDYYHKRFNATYYLESYGIHSVIISSDEQFLVVGELYRCKIFHLKDFQVYHIFRTHKHEIVSLIDSPNGAYLFSGDSHGIIKSYDFPKKYEIKALTASEKKVVKMIVTADNEYLIATHEDNITNIWAISKMIKIHTMEQSHVVDIQYPGNATLMFSLYETSLKGFVIPSLTSCYLIRFHGKASEFCFSAGEESIAVFIDKTICVFKNPQHCTQTTVFGELEHLNYFYQQIGKLVSGKVDKHDSIMNHWIIEPFHINIMHLYAFLDKNKLLAQCFEENVGFFPSKSGFTPLDIVLDMDFEKSIDLMYTEIKKISRKNPLFLFVLENSLVRINNSVSQSVFKFYSLAVYKSIDTRLPRFYHSARKLPIILFNRNVLAHKSSFMREDEYANDGKEITFKQTYFRVNMIPGSNESLKFVKSVIETDNELLFTTEFFKLILQEKWKIIKRILQFQAIIYSSYLVLISVYSSINELNTLKAAFGLNVALIFYEISQVATGGLDYFKDAWNYIDILRAASMTYLFVSDILSYQSSRSLIVTALVLFVSWIRGISYFRLIKNTRYYVNLIYEVIFDIIPFLTILFYSTVAFSLIFRSLMKEDDTSFNYLKVSWEINVGGFTTSSYNALMYLAFFLNTVLNPIIMLNLLISIMSNTYKKVNKQVIVADSKELAGMILEGELMYFWNRNKEEKHYLHICSSKKKKVAIEDSNMKKVKTKIEELMLGQGVIKREMEEMKGKMRKMKKMTKAIFNFVSKAETNK